ncbi:hypothetical protein [Lactobacillus mulieris]
MIVMILFVLVLLIL